MRKYNSLFETEFAKIGGKSLSSSLKGVSIAQIKSGDIEEVWAKVDDENELGRKPGNYITYTIKSDVESNKSKLVDKLSMSISRLLGKKHDRVLILGMGNSAIISDALGVKVNEKIDITTFMNGCGNARVSKFCPGVFAVSGFHSFEIVSALNSIFLPDVIIVVDSLCAGSVSRLGKSFQITDAGITPGSAMGDNICNITSSSMGGAKVVSIGVPVVIYLKSILEEATEKLKPLEQDTLEVLNDFDGIFSPKEIDEIIEFSSDVIAKAIEKSLT